MVPRGRRCFAAEASAFKTRSPWIVGPAVHPTTVRENQSMTTASESHPRRVQGLVMFVAQAALRFVGENWRWRRFGVSTTGLPTPQRRV